jgi:hypothetical protein
VTNDMRGDYPSSVVSVGPKTVVSLLQSVVEWCAGPSARLPPSPARFAAQHALPVVCSTNQPSFIACPFQSDTSGMAEGSAYGCNVAGACCVRVLCAEPSSTRFVAPCAVRCSTDVGVLLWPILVFVGLCLLAMAYHQRRAIRVRPAAAARTRRPG